MIHGEVQGLMVWHFYRDGKLVNSKTEEFAGDIKELTRKTSANFEEMADKPDGYLVRIFHTFIPL